MLSTSLLELACLFDAVMAGTHELTPEGVEQVRDRLDEAAAVATAMEQGILDQARFWARHGQPGAPAPSNVVPFPGPEGWS